MMIKLSGIVDLRPLKEDERWIQKAIKHPGALHKQLGVPAGEKIPAGKLSAAAEKGGKLGKRARLAQTLRKLKEEYKLSENQIHRIDALIEKLDPTSHINKLVSEDMEEQDDTNVTHGDTDHEGDMARAQLMTVHKQSGELFNMISEQEHLEPWVQDKLSKAADYVNVVYNYLHYQKNKHASLGNGMGAPADGEPTL
jgi:hypothetical protein